MATKARFVLHVSVPSNVRPIQGLRSDLVDQRRRIGVDDLQVAIEAPCDLSSATNIENSSPNSESGLTFKCAAAFRPEKVDAALVIVPAQNFPVEG